MFSSVQWWNHIVFQHSELSLFFNTPNNKTMHNHIYLPHPTIFQIMFNIRNDRRFCLVVSFVLLTAIIMYKSHNRTDRKATNVCTKTSLNYGSKLHNGKDVLRHGSVWLIIEQVTGHNVQYVVHYLCNFLYTSNVF